MYKKNSHSSILLKWNKTGKNTFSGRQDILYLYCTGTSTCTSLLLLCYFHKMYKYCFPSRSVQADSGASQEVQPAGGE